VAQTVKRLLTMRETQVQSLGWEDPLEKEMAIHSSTIAWKIPWTEEPLFTPCHDVHSVAWFYKLRGKGKKLKILGFLIFLSLETIVKA